MPKIVDWDARRDEILAATWRVIARDGIARATITAIAREAGCSRGILAHYFDDKADILGSALLLSHRRVVARMEARAAGLTGLAALRVIMLEALPLDSERDLEAQIEISFWGRALGNPALRRLQHAEFDRFTDRLRGHLVEAEKYGELRESVDIGLAAHQLLVLIDGLSAQRVLYPDRVTPERQQEMLDELLGTLRPSAVSLTAASLSCVLCRPRDVIGVTVSQHGSGAPPQCVRCTAAHHFGDWRTKDEHHEQAGPGWGHCRDRRCDGRGQRGPGRGGVGGAGGAGGAGNPINGPVYGCVFQTVNGHYLTAVGGGGRTTDVIHTDATRIGSWEKFTLIDSGSGTPVIQYGLLTTNGHYLTAVGGGGRTTDVIHSDATHLLGWEMFTLNSLGGGVYDIQTLDGHYVTAVGGGGRTTDTIHTDATRVGAWEKFTVSCGH